MTEANFGPKPYRDCRYNAVRKTSPVPNPTTTNPTRLAGNTSITALEWGDWASKKGEQKYAAQHP